MKGKTGSSDCLSLSNSNSNSNQREKEIEWQEEESTNNSSTSAKDKESSSKSNPIIFLLDDDNTTNDDDNVVNDNFEVKQGEDLYPHRPSNFKHQSINDVNTTRGNDIKNEYTTSSPPQEIVAVQSSASASTIASLKDKPHHDAAITPKTHSSESHESQQEQSIGLSFYHNCAYVQNLAEISHDILHDARWRTRMPMQQRTSSLHKKNDTTTIHPNQQHPRLFRWEYGDDLSALYALEKLFLDDENSTRILQTSSSSSSSLSPNTTTTRKETATTTKPRMSSSSSIQQQQNNMRNNENYEREARYIHLYARLFHRKGPWFTLVDVFIRYYHRDYIRRTQWKWKNTSSSKSHQESDVTTSSTSSSGVKETNNDSDSNDHEERVEENAQSLATTTTTTTWESIQASIIDFIQDIQQLYFLGLIRSFRSEEECGILAGNSSSSSSSLLTEKDRLSVLRKLGGGYNTTTSTAARSTNKKNSRSNDHDNDNKRRKRQRGSRGGQLSTNINEIWKQMHKQKSIFFQPTNNYQNNTNGKSSSSTTLPVVKHVNQVLLDNFGHKVKSVLTETKSSPTSTILSLSKSDIVQFFKVEWDKAWSTSNSPLSKKSSSKVTSHHSMSNTPTTLFTCFRLREEPLLTLRRASRLYLCAGKGPGVMRGSSDGSNAWLSTREGIVTPIVEEKNPELIRTRELLYLVNEVCTLPEYPTATQWHKVEFPGLNFRLNLVPCSMMKKNHSRIPAGKKEINDLIYEIDENDNNDNSDTKYEPHHEALNHNLQMVEVFRDTIDFQLWEYCAEIRNHIDYLLEWNRILLYADRKIKRKAQRKESDENNNNNNNDNIGMLQSQGEISSLCPDMNDDLDCLSVDGRKSFVEKLLMFQKDKNENISGSSTTTCHSDSTIQIQNSIEDTIMQITKSTDKDAEGGGDNFYNDTERTICSIAVICQHILLHRLQTFCKHDAMTLIKRPWLRHLYWECSLSYILWDCVEILEKRSYHQQAVNILETLLYGMSTTNSTNSGGEDNGLENKIHKEDGGSSYMKSFIQVMLSRRVRGKAMERLVIDRNHMELKKKKRQKKNISQRRTSGKKKKNSHTSSENNAIDVEKLYLQIINDVASTASLPFSFIRKLARRCKVPLSTTMKHIKNIEVRELGLRLEDDRPPPRDASSIVVKSEKLKKKDKQQKSKYCDWSPVTDFAVANALTKNDSDEGGGVGKRCSFIGYEDDTHHSRSLNVEELAVEEYHSGNLPNKDNTNDFITIVKGGWKGWHDEGKYIRILFRVLCFEPLLQCNPHLTHHHTTEENAIEEKNVLEQEHQTIFLTPYQDIPLDLHVAHTILPHQEEEASTDSGGEVNHEETRGFYTRRRRCIEEFLNKLQTMSPQELADLVYNTIMNRQEEEQLSNKSGKITWIRPNAGLLLGQDISEIRTLSMLAAGLGGKMLTAIFRCLCYDYRHYGAGLPDLLLVRAVKLSSPQDDDDDASCTSHICLNIGEWIGETFGRHQEEDKKNINASIWTERDEEFLGGGTLSEANKTGGSFAGPSSKAKSNSNEKLITEIPKKLSLIHENEIVTVQCMFVEVKSANDTLDERQVDWLNILDREGEARVCKFVSSKKVSSREEQ